MPKSVPPPSPLPHVKSAAGPGPGRPKDLSKRAAILDSAKRLFTREGFAGTSMDQIATEAGVSKLTVYSHFGDKDTLFTQVICAMCDEMLPLDLFQIETKSELREQLRSIAQAFFTLITSEEAISTQRMMLIPGHIDDRLKQMFWQAGPQRTLNAFAALLQTRVDAGELDIADTPLASQQFFTLIKGELHNRMMCGLQAAPYTREVITRHLDASVDMFLRTYGKPR